MDDRPGTDWERRIDTLMLEQAATTDAERRHHPHERDAERPLAVGLCEAQADEREVGDREGEHRAERVDGAEEVGHGVDAELAQIRRQQDRLAYSMARIGPVQREALRKRILARVPVHYFALVRLVAIHRRLRTLPELHVRLVRVLPRLVVAEWTLGASATRYALFPPPTQGQSGDGFR